MNGSVIYNILKVVKNYTYYASVIPYKVLRYVNAGDSRPYFVDRLTGLNIIDNNVEI